MLRAIWAAQFSQGPGLDLPDALAGNAKLSGDLLEGVLGVHADTKSHHQDLGLPRGEGVEDLADGYCQPCVRGRVVAT